MQEKEKSLFEKEAMEKDALNRILWDPKLKPEEFDVYYVDRFSGKLTKVNFSDLRLAGDFLEHDESLIPLHRIRRIEQRGRVVWEKRRIG